MRAGGGDEGVFVENDNCVLSEIDETDFDEVDTNAVTLDVDDDFGSIPSISPSLLTESRTSPYPASGVIRFPVPDHFVCWTVSNMYNKDLGMKATTSSIAE